MHWHIHFVCIFGVLVVFANTISRFVYYFSLLQMCFACCFYYYYFFIYISLADSELVFQSVRMEFFSVVSFCFASIRFTFLNDNNEKEICRLFTITRNMEIVLGHLIVIERKNVFFTSCTLL